MRRNRFGGGQCVAHSAVALFHFDAEGGNEVVQTIRTQSGEGFPAQPHGTQLLARVGITQAGKLLPDEAIIKRGIVRHKYRPLRHFHYFFGHLEKAGRIFHHILCDAGQFRNAVRNVGFGVEQGFVSIQNVLAIVQNDGNFRDAVQICTPSGGLNINNGVSFSGHSANLKQKI